jgi:hypothetical protein
MRALLLSSYRHLEIADMPPPVPANNIMTGISSTSAGRLRLRPVRAGVWAVALDMRICGLNVIQQQGETR